MANTKQAKPCNGKNNKNMIKKMAELTHTENTNLKKLGSILTTPPPQNHKKSQHGLKITIC